MAQFNDSLPDLPFAPTTEWAEKFKEDFKQVGDYFRTNNVGVVNISWSDDVAEIEKWLTRTSSKKDPAVSRRRPSSKSGTRRSRMPSAAPPTAMLSSLERGSGQVAFAQLGGECCRQAGEETSFTSYGNTVVVDADGYEVESYVPGGTKLKMSGTSMATFNVANLAAKLIALDPSLTPEQTIALIRKAADKNADGRRNLINPKATIEF